MLAEILQQRKFAILIKTTSQMKKLLFLFPTKK